MSEVPEDEALMRLKLQPKGELFPCCDGTEEISQSSSNDTPAPERTVCQPCSTGSQLVPPTKVGGRLGEGESEQDDESQEEDVGDSDSNEKAFEEAEAVGKDKDVVEKEAFTRGTISGKFMAEAAPVDESEAPADVKLSVEDTILAAKNPAVAQTKKVVEEVVQITGEKAEEQAPKSSVRGKPV